MTGRLFREFSIVISGAVIISAFVALSFVPMLSSKLLKSNKKKVGFTIKQRCFYRDEPFLRKISSIISTT